MKELIEKVKQWGLDRNIVFTGAEGQDKRAMMEAQARYTLKETAELLDAYADQDIDKINDAIGDILVTLIVGASSDDDIFNELKDRLSSGRYNKLPVIISGNDFYEGYSKLVFWGLFLEKDYLRSLECYSLSISYLDSLLACMNDDFDQELSLKDCLELAYSEIKNRTGKVVNGQFIKDK